MRDSRGTKTQKQKKRAQNSTRAERAKPTLTLSNAGTSKRLIGNYTRKAIIENQRPPTTTTRGEREEEGVYTGPQLEACYLVVKRHFRAGKALDGALVG